MKRSHGLLSLFGDYGDLATAFSDVEHTIAGIALSEDGVAFPVFPDTCAAVSIREKRFKVKGLPLAFTMNVLFEPLVGPILPLLIC